MNISIDKVTEEMLKEVMKKRRVPLQNKRVLGSDELTERNEMEESEQKRQLELLGVIKAELERDISAFDTEDAETVYDKEEDASISPCISAKEKDVFAVVTHDGQLINYSSNIPKILIANIHNILIRTMNQVRFGEIYA